ncbi:hypothetical protein D918_09759 [Trichuris suis]|nr:hypothetical protein D918_09759 [Trichuris suis]
MARPISSFRAVCFSSYFNITAPFGTDHFQCLLGSDVNCIVEHFESRHLERLTNRVEEQPWLSSFEALLDLYSFSLQSKLITVEKWTRCLRGNEKLGDHFISSFAHFSSVALSWSSDGTVLDFITQRSPLMKRRKCALLAYVNFLTLFVQQYQEKFEHLFAVIVENKNVWCVVLKCIFESESMGFSDYATETTEFYSVKIPALFNALKTNNPLCAYVSSVFTDLLKKWDTFDVIIDCLYPFSQYPWPDLGNVLSGDFHDMSETGRIIHGYALLKKMDKLPAGLISNCDNVWELLMSSCFGRQAVLLYSTELLSARVRFAKQILCIVPITTAQVKSLVHILADCQLVKLFNFSPVETKGNEAFASLFETEIATLFCHNSATFLEQAIYAFEGNDEGFIQLLCSLLNCIVHSSNLRKRCGSRIVENIVSPCISKMSLWSDVSISSEQVKLLWVKFVMKLLLIDSKVVNWPCSDVIYRCYFKLLNDQSVSLGFKNQMLTLLAAFCTSEKEKDNIESELKLFIVNNFPLNSSEFEPDTAKFKEYITTCERFCDAFANTGCLVILDLLLMVVCREEKHPVISYLHDHL